MSVKIALRLAALRKEKGLSQKEAASELEVSQALLSHYEKGIRECRLDFITKACDYYDVTADYLLGLTDNRHGLNDIYTKGTLPADFELRINTLFRCMVSLSEKLSAAGDSAENRLQTEIMLSVYRFALMAAKYDITSEDWFSLDIRDADRMASMLLDRMFLSEKLIKDSGKGTGYDQEPEFMKTLITNTEEFLRSKYSRLLGMEQEEE